jgi:arylformamidase
MAKAEWIDISLSFSSEMPVLPSGLSDRPAPPPRIERVSDAEKGDKVTTSRLDISTHEGTHIDAPLHFFFGGSTIDQMPIEMAIGPARVVEIYDKESIKSKEIANYDFQPGERILFKTRNSAEVYKTRQYTGSYVYFTADAAVFLAGKKVGLVGLDYLTVGDAKSQGNIREVHETLLGTGIYVLEGINLAGVKPGRYELVCVPLRIEKGDASPCRAVIRPIK